MDSFDSDTDFLLVDDTPKASSLDTFDLANEPETPASPQSLISISTVFHLDAHLHSLYPDTLLISSDNVHFHVHHAILCRASHNAFDHFLESTSPALGCQAQIRIPEDATHLNMILLCIYGLPCHEYATNLDILLATVDALCRYGIDSGKCVSPSTPLFSEILAQSPISPIQAFATAAHHDLFPLASSISPQLLSADLTGIEDTVVIKMGPVYLKRLWSLHGNRLRTLKELLFVVPNEHVPSMECGFVDQKRVQRAWALATASLAWEAQPDLSASFILSVLGSLRNFMSCGLCIAALNKRIAQLILQWTTTKRTI
ncbi:hypothetical protein K474DRAFT_417682 [Panus rudis PR-1116 ss-1]|nr:hypothetical protein K474DRAFT_417682 [Panus rudis PR-1116 ss-1]